MYPRCCHFRSSIVPRAAVHTWFSLKRYSTTYFNFPIVQITAFDSFLHQFQWDTRHYLTVTYVYCSAWQGDGPLAACGELSLLPDLSDLSNSSSSTHQRWLICLQGLRTASCRLGWQRTKLCDSFTETWSSYKILTWELNRVFQPLYQLRDQSHVTPKEKQMQIYAFSLHLSKLVWPWPVEILFTEGLLIPHYTKWTSRKSSKVLGVTCRCYVTICFEWPWMSSLLF